MNNRGFTLVEILVVIFIIVLMSGIIFANYRSIGQQFALQRSANKLALDIRRVQEMAMSAKEFHGIVPEGGYGIRVLCNSGLDDCIWNSYILYADCNNNGLYDGVIVDSVNPWNQDNPDLACDDGVDCPCGVGHYSEKVEQIQVEKGVRTGIGPDWMHGRERVIFTPPDPTVTIIHGICNPFTGFCAFPFPPLDLLTASVFLENDNTKTKTIRVNKAGLIEIE